MKITASTMLNSMWNSAVILAASGCSAVNSRAISVQEWQRDERSPTSTVDQIAERQATACRIAAAAAFEQRIDRAAEISAEHQRQRGLCVTKCE